MPGASSQDTQVECPACGDFVSESFLNAHLDLGCASKPSVSKHENKSDPPRVAGPARASVPSKDASQPGAPPNYSLFTKAKGKERERPREDAPPPAKRFKGAAAVLRDAQPLAERVRPSLLDDYVGQAHIMGEDSPLRALIEADRLPSCVLWGPAGSGKTTLARIIAKRTKKIFKELSATNTSVADIRKVFDDAANLLRLTGQGTVLFIDEIQRFNKAQQDLFLPFIEAGTSKPIQLSSLPVDASQVTCLCATTENPSFRLNTALLSRCRVFTLAKLTAEDCQKILERALKLYRNMNPDSKAIVKPDLIDFLAQTADGDARVALHTLEMALQSLEANPELPEAALKESLKRAHLTYDRKGDAHYDTISALHKSVRGSDVNASLYWLARMLESGEDPLYVARRMIRMASEDIGTADPTALPLCVSAYQATQLLGMPECDVILAHAVAHLAQAPKSIQVYKAYGAAKQLVASKPAYPVPLHIRNAPTKLMKDLDYGLHYRYNPSFAHPVHQTYLPPELDGQCSFFPSAHLGSEVDQAALEEWETLDNGGKPWEGRATLAASSSTS